MKVLKWLVIILFSPILLTWNLCYLVVTTLQDWYEVWWEE